MAESGKSTPMSKDHQLKPTLLIMGQTPPPWHGQAVATEILFNHDWPSWHVERLRMNYSSSMNEVGRFSFQKLRHLIQLIREARQQLSKHHNCALFYPPASAHLIPFLRDFFFLACVRPKAHKTVFIFHASGLANFCSSNWLVNWCAMIAYGQADLALEVAEEKISPHEALGSKSHTWCPCGIDAPSFEPKVSKQESRPLEVLFVGSLQDGKGILEIIKTAAILKSNGHAENFHFKLVGQWMSKTFEAEAMNLFHSLKLEDMVTLAGQLTGDDKWQAYREADVFFFPSHYPTEASPIVLMEALAAGLAIVTTEWNGIPALMKGCASAQLLPIHSPEQYADALMELQSKRDQLPEYAKASRSFYEANFTPAKFIERVETALHPLSQES